MSNQAFVNEILAKDTKAGTMYDFVMSNGEKVGAGKFKPKGIEVGDYIQYEVKMNGNFKNFAPGSVSKLAKPEGVTPPSSKPNFVPSGDKRQEIISKQAALNSAMQFVTILAANGGLPKIPKASEAADILLQVVNRYTALFYRQSTGEDIKFPDTTKLDDGSLDREGLAAAEGQDNWEG